MTGPQLTQGQSYDLEVRASGSQCAGYVGGVQIGGTQTITQHQTDTQHGLYVHESQDHRFENFSVEAEAGPMGWLAEPGYFNEPAVMRPLEYVRARWYEAGGPGWLSKDPIGLGGGDVNLYRYVRNRPLTLIDPLGKAPFFNCKKQFEEILKAIHDLQHDLDQLQEFGGVTNPGHAKEIRQREDHLRQEEKKYKDHGCDQRFRPLPEMPKVPVRIPIVVPGKGKGKGRTQRFCPPPMHPIPWWERVPWGVVGGTALVVGGLVLIALSGGEVLILAPALL